MRDARVCLTGQREKWPAGALLLLGCIFRGQTKRDLRSERTCQPGPLTFVVSWRSLLSLSRALSVPAAKGEAAGFASRRDGRSFLHSLVLLFLLFFLGFFADLCAHLLLCPTWVALEPDLVQNRANIATGAIFTTANKSGKCLLLLVFFLWAKQLPGTLFLYSQMITVFCIFLFFFVFTFDFPIYKCFTC